MQAVGIDSLVGKLLGEYQVEQRLGRGELSTVYVARRSARDQKVMVIIFNPPEGISAQEHQQFTARFTQEGSALVRLKHPNLLPTYDFGELSGHPYLVTALVKGVSLNQLLKQQGRFTLQQALDVLKQVASALDYAHSNGVVHGLLSSSNILVNQELEAQIVNFGMGVVLSLHRSIQDERPVAARSDIQALGIVLFELLSGTSPFGEAGSSALAVRHFLQPVPSIHAQCPDVPEALDLVMDRALEQDPARGYRRAGDIIIAVERILKAVKTISGSGNFSTRKILQNAQAVLPPTVNWFDEASIFPARSGSGEEWEQASLLQDGSAAKTSFSMPPSDALAEAGAAPYSLHQPAQRSRRKVLGLMAAGTITASVLAVAGINLLRSMQQSPAQLANVPANTQKTGNNANNASAMQPTQGTQSTVAPATPSTPQPTASPVAHTGMVIGSTSQVVNSAQSFTNPVDGQACLLIRLPNGKFVASEMACTHAQAPVKYNAGTQKLVCPAHGAVFDPANGFSHVSGPGSRPLAAVAIRVNGDGTITTG